LFRTIIDWWFNRDIDRLLHKREIDVNTAQLLLEIRDGVKSATFFLVLVAFVIGGFIKGM